MERETNRDVDRLVVGHGLASQPELEKAKRQIEQSGRPVTLTRVLDALVESGVISDGQARRVRDSAEPFTPPTGQALCSECGRTAAVRETDVLPSCPTCGGKLVYHGTTMRHPGELASATTLAGTTIEGGCGTYRIVESIGAGGFSSVFRAQLIDKQTGAGYDRAIKVLHPHLAGRQDSMDAFLAEARALQQITHPSVIRVYESGLHGDLPYIVMDLARGRSLNEILQERADPLPVSIALAIGARVASALREVHAVGLIHRDVKPANIVVRHEGDPASVQALLLDFGVARLADGATSERPTYAGTKHYESPEQEEGAPLPASDIWGLGVVLYRMLNGRPPNTPPQGTPRARLSQQQARRRAPCPFDKLDTSPEVQAEVETHVKDCLRPTPERRPTADTLAIALEHLRAKALTVPATGHGADAPRAWRKPALWAATVTGVLALLGILWVVTAPNRESPEPDRGGPTKSGQHLPRQQTASTSAKDNRIVLLRSQGRFTEAFRLVNGLRFADSDEAAREEESTVQAVRASIRALIAECEFRKATDTVDQVRLVRLELAETLANEADAARREFTQIATQILGKAVAWPQCGHLLRELYAAEAKAGGFAEAERILAAFEDSGERYRPWTDANLDRSLLDRSKREFSVARDRAAAAITDALEQALDETKWQAALSACQTLQAYTKNPEPPAMAEACRAGSALARLFRDVDAQIAAALRADRLTLATLNEHLDRARKSLSGRVRQRLREAAQMLDTFHAQIQSLPSPQDPHPRHFEEAVAVRDPNEFLSCLEKALSARAKNDGRAWHAIWDGYYAQLPPRPEKYRRVAAQYRDLMPSRSEVAGIEQAVLLLCGQGRFGEAFDAVDQLRGRDAQAAQELDRQVTVAVTNEADALLKRRQYAQARTMAREVKRRHTQLAATLVANADEAEFGDACRPVKETMEAERAKLEFDSQRWRDISAACKRLGQQHPDRADALTLADDCRFYMTEAQARATPASSQWRVWKTFLEENPQSVHAAQAIKSKNWAQQEGQKQLDALLTPIAQIGATIEAQRDREHAVLRKALDEATRTLERVDQQARQLCLAFEQTLRYDSRVLAELRNRIAFEEHRAKATAADEPERRQVWKRFLEHHAKSACASRAVHAMSSMVLDQVNTCCESFDAATEDPPKQDEYSRIQKRLDRVHVVLKGYEEDFAGLPGFDLSALRQKLDCRRRRLNAKLVVISRPAGAEVTVNGERAPGRTPLSYDQVLTQCVYDITLTKEHCRPCREEATISKEGETAIELTLDELVPKLPAKLRADIWRLPDKDVDQYGNPVVTRNGLRCDPSTKLPYEIWLDCRDEWRPDIFVKRKVHIRMELVLVPWAEHMVSRIDDEYRANAVGAEGSNVIPALMPERMPTLMPERLPGPLYLGKYEVTKAQFSAYDTWEGKHLTSQADAEPAFSVDWGAATKFCKKLSAAAEARIWLPSDTAWECACRAGTTSRYPWGDTFNPKYGNFGANRGARKPKRVGSIAPNAYGFYDMIGNVGEWCDEWHSDTRWPYHSICRGGDFLSPEIALTSHFRYLARKDSNRDRRGFRVCVAVPNGS